MGGVAYFVRVAPRGIAYGPFATRDATNTWLIANGFELAHETGTFKVYEAHDPPLYDAHNRMDVGLG